MNRRQFWGTGAAAALALKTGLPFTARAGESAGAAGGSRIGMILYTIRDFLKTPDDIARSLAKVKQIGYDNIELAGLGPIDNARLARIVKDNALTVISAHASWDGLTKEIQKEIDQYKELGCNHLVISALPTEFRSTKGFHQFAQVASGIGQKLADAGMFLAYHNHSFEFVKYGAQTGQEILRTASDPKYFGFEIDTYWVQDGGADPADWIRKAAGRVRMVHMKDMAMLPVEKEFHPKRVFAEVGEGNLNWPAILEASKAAKVQYYIVEQDTCQRDPMESIAISLRNMKSWGLA
ncbi:MAG: sugar phosphate isomerase/epimerase family protein [bacterium]